MKSNQLLEKAIESCETLSNLTYNIVVAKNSKEFLIRLLFLKSDFSHILGLHYFKDITQLRSEQSSERRYELVKNNVANVRQLMVSSRYFERIVPRLKAIAKLESILDSNKELYYKRPEALGNSVIHYDFLIKGVYEKVCFAFVVEDRNETPRYVVESIFEGKNRDYSFGRRPYSLLFKCKIDKASNREELLFSLKSEELKKYKKEINEKK